MPRAGIYARISSDPEGRALGTNRQVEDCRELAVRHKLTVVDTYVDDNLSASSRSRKARPAFDRLMRDAESGRIDTIVVYSGSRLTRRPAEWEPIITLAETRRIRLLTVASGEPDLNRADGRAVLRTIAAWDAAEAERTGERVSRAAQQRAERGDFAGGWRRFGFQHSEVDAKGRPSGPIVLVDDEAEAIREAYRRLLAGTPLREIARDWAARGLRMPGGAIPSPQKVRRILLREMNAGWSMYRGEQIGTSQAPALVDEATFLSARKLLAARATGPGRPPTGLLTGLLRCGECGVALNAAGAASYRCNAGGHVSRSRPRLDAMISDLVVAYLVQHQHALSRMATTAVVEGGADFDELARLRAELGVLPALLASGDLGAVDFARATRTLRARIEEIQAHLTRDAPTSPAVAELVGAPDIARAWEGLDVEARRRVIAELIEEVVVRSSGPGRFDPRSIEVVWAGA